MKRIKLLVATMLLSGLFTAGYGQQQPTQTQLQTQTGAPQAFKYQALARNANGDAIANQNVSFRISILEGSANGTTVYQETQTAMTNQFGLANLSIGMGTATNGTFNTIQWGNNTYFVKVEFDPKGGSDYAYMGTTQMLSVPYSLYAEHAKTADNISSSTMKVALQATNLQAPFDAPETGMLVYNTDSSGTGLYSVVPGYYYNAGTATDPNWVLLSSESNNASHKGGFKDNCPGGSTNAFGCNSGNLGLTGGDNTGYGDGAAIGLSSGSDNSALGYQALSALTVGSYDIAIGSNAMPVNKYANHNIAVGYESQYHQNYGSSAWNSYNVGIGDYTLYYTLSTSTSNGMRNTAVGYNVLGGNSTGIDNTGIGFYALKEASYSTGISNTASGAYSLYNVSSGSFNTGDGDSALYNNSDGNYNTADGYLALASNSSGNYNTADGYNALNYNSTGKENTAVGDDAGALISGSYNTGIGSGAAEVAGGSYNTALGYIALSAANTSSSNTAIGTNAMLNTTWGSWNTALGDSAGYLNTNGTYNTFIGYQAGTTAGSAAYTNCTSLGYGALSKASNSVNLGNNSVTAVYAPAAVTGFTSYSDRRIKNNIKENVPGLAFINKLRPVTYNFNIHKANEMQGIKDNKEWDGKYDKEKVTVSGFIAQEVDSAANAIHFNFCGIDKPTTPDGLYSLRYTDFIVPMVKAIQEQQQIIDSTEKQTAILSAKIDSLEKINSIQATVIKTMQTGEETVQSQQNNRIAGEEKEIADLKKMMVSLMQEQASIKK